MNIYRDTIPTDPGRSLGKINGRQPVRIYQQHKQNRSHHHLYYHNNLPWTIAFTKDIKDYKKTCPSCFVQFFHTHSNDAKMTQEEIAGRRPKFQCIRNKLESNSLYRLNVSNSGLSLCSWLCYLGRHFLKPGSSSRWTIVQVSCCFEEKNLLKAGLLLIFGIGNCFHVMEDVSHKRIMFEERK